MASILVVEDDDHVRALLREALEGAGHQVYEAQDGGQALETVRHARIQLVITDILLAGKQGFDLIVNLRLNFPIIRVFAISGGGVTGQLPLLEVARTLGASRTFKKPFNIHELLWAVKEELSS